MSIEDSKSETGKGINRQRWFEERHKQMDAIEMVLKSGMEKGAFEIEHVQTEARVLRGMVRSVLTCPEDGLSVDQMVAVIVRIFLLGVKKKN